MGKMMNFLTDRDKKWLSEAHPELKPNENCISGLIEFTATYDEQSGRFFPTEKEVKNTDAGVLLSGSFSINIKERTNTSISKLPALYVEGVDTTADRHFNQNDHSACLCSPLEEDEFLVPQFHFIPFIERLIIPFLYSQIFYSKENKWPWPEYAHGAVGILESYTKIKDPDKIYDCLKQLARDSNAWPKIRTALLQKDNIKGGLPCFCKTGDHRRRCHPNALSGIRQLKDDLKNSDAISYLEELDSVFKNPNIRPFNSPMLYAKIKA